MNATFPENTGDYDAEFIYILSINVLQLLEIGDFLKTNNLRSFNRERLHFVKSNMAKIVYNRVFYYCLIIFSMFHKGIYEERVRDDKNRNKAFRKHLQDALQQFNKKKYK